MHTYPDPWDHVRAYTPRNKRERAVLDVAMSYARAYTTREVCTETGLHAQTVAYILMSAGWPRNFHPAHGNISIWSPYKKSAP